MNSGKYVDAPPMLRDFLTYNEAIRGKSRTTVDEYYLDLQTFFRYLKKIRGLTSHIEEFERIDISDVDIKLLKTVTLSDLYAFLVYCKNERDNIESTRARKTTCLRMFFRYLTNKVHMLDVSPAEELESPKIKKTLPKYLTLDQSIELLQAVDGENRQRDYCILVLFLNCGLRLSELCALNMTDIHSDGTMRILGKGNKERIVYLNEACESSIKSYLSVRPVDGVKSSDKNALFISRLNKRIGTQAVQKIVSKYLEKIGLEGQGYSPHKLRHTAATLMYQEAGVDVRVLKDFLGHENLNTTQIYTHVSNKQVKDAAYANPLSKQKQRRSVPVNNDSSSLPGKKSKENDF